MKDLRFTSQAGTVNVVYRVDLINTQSGNFTVHTISGLEIEAGTAGPRQYALYQAFRKLPYNIQNFQQFAVQYGLNLTISDTDGSNSVLLVGYSNSDSQS